MSPKKCVQAGCPETPIFAFTWPGKAEECACPVHARIIAILASEMVSYSVEMIPICQFCGERAVSSISVNSTFLELANAGKCYDGTFVHCRGHHRRAMKCATDRRDEARRRENAALLGPRLDPS